MMKETSSLVPPGDIYLEIVPSLHVHEISESLIQHLSMNGSHAQCQVGSPNAHDTDKTCLRPRRMKRPRSTSLAPSPTIRVLHDIHTLTGSTLLLLEGFDMTCLDLRSFFPTVMLSSKVSVSNARLTHQLAATGEIREDLHAMCRRIHEYLQDMGFQFDGQDVLHIRYLPGHFGRDAFSSVLSGKGVYCRHDFTNSIRGQAYGLTLVYDATYQRYLWGIAVEVDRSTRPSPDTAQPPATFDNTLVKVWDTHLKQHFSFRSKGMGVHLGSGTWIQAMRQQIGIDQVVGIGTASVPDCVLQLQGVSCVEVDATSDMAASALAKHSHPIQLVVCDAEMELTKALSSIVTLMEKLENRRFFSSTPLWTLPAACVVKVAASEESESLAMDVESDIIPQLQALAATAYGEDATLVRVRHQLVRMAPSEHVLLAVFDAMNIVA